MDTHDCFPHAGGDARRQALTPRSLIVMIVGALGLALGVILAMPAAGYTCWLTARA